MSSEIDFLVYKAKRFLDILAEEASKRISNQYNVKIESTVGLSISHPELLSNLIKVSGPRMKYIARDIYTAKKIRDLHHSSGFKYSRMIPIEDGFLIDCRTTDQIVFGDTIHPRYLRPLFITLFLRSVKRLKMLLKNTKF